jgi:LysM repeat protein
MSFRGRLKLKKAYFVILAIILLIGLFFNSDSLKGSFLASASESAEDLFAQPLNNVLRDSPELNLVQKNSIMSVAPPATIDSQTLGALLGGSEEEQEIRKEIIEHIIEPGDTLSSLVDEYGVSLNTILWANDLTSKSILKVGQKLIILPTTGVIYNVENGDVLSEIAVKHKAKVSEIISYNNLSSEGDVFIGDILIIPNGEKPKVVSTYVSVPIGSSYFIAPLSKYVITQGLHWYNAVDFASSCGDPVLAAAGGTVQRVSYGYNYGAGNTITILHPNGVVTSYGHIASSLVISGQQVSQGEIIALEGGKPGTKGAGISTGCHVHFSVRGASNPFAK